MSDPVWQRLGEALQRRRVELDPRYRNLALFARERGLNERLVSDIEHARRSGYRKGTRHALEIAYGLDAGRLDRFAAGEVDSLGHVTAPGATIPDDDPVVEYVRLLPGLSPARRESLEYVARSPGLLPQLRRAYVAMTIATWEQEDAAENRSSA